MTNATNTQQTVIVLVRGSHTGNGKKKAERVGTYSVTMRLMTEDGSFDERPEATKEWSEEVSGLTANQAILTGIAKSFEAFKRKGVKVIIQTTSQYAIGVLNKDWKAGKNLDFIAAAHAAMQGFEVQYDKI